MTNCQVPTICSRIDFARCAAALPAQSPAARHAAKNGTTRMVLLLKVPKRHLIKRRAEKTIEEGSFRFCLGPLAQMRHQGAFAQADGFWRYFDQLIVLDVGD